MLSLNKTVLALSLPVFFKNKIYHNGPGFAVKGDRMSFEAVNLTPCKLAKQNRADIFNCESPGLKALPVFFLSLLYNNILYLVFYQSAVIHKLLG